MLDPWPRRLQALIGLSPGTVHPHLGYWARGLGLGAVSQERSGEIRVKAPGRAACGLSVHAVGGSGSLFPEGYSRP